VTSISLMTEILRFLVVLSLRFLLLLLPMKLLTQENVVVGGAVMAGLLFFGAAFSKCSPSFPNGLNSSASEADASVSALRAEQSKWEKESKQLQAKFDSLDTDHEALQSKWEGLDAEAKLCSEQLASARAELAAVKARLAAEEAALEGEKLTLMTQVSGLESEISGLAAAAAASDALKAELMALKSEHAASEEAHNKSALMAEELKNGRDAARSRARELQAQLNQMKASENVFVRSVNDLPASAQRLFSDLKKLEGKSKAEVDAAYTKYVDSHQSKSLARIKFATGSAEISAADIANIKNLTQTSNKNAYFLVVGFADSSGDAAGNETLSSNRSTAVAQELAKHKQGYQAAQAVYLGQTTRFGEPEENRVVEIWEIN